MLVTLASSGPVRAIALQELFGELRTSNVCSLDQSGIVRDWEVQNRMNRGQRGRAVALDPAFPLYKRVMRVFKALAVDFPFKATHDLTEAEVASIPDTVRRFDFEALFVSGNRLRVLATLEALRGRARVSKLLAALPNMRENLGKNEIRKLVRDKILAKDGTVVHFVEGTWTRPYRALLRAYLASKPDLVAAIKETAKHKRTLRSAGNKARFLGRAALERTMLALSAHGPLPTADVERITAVREVQSTLKKLIESGIVARIFVDPLPNERSGHYVFGFNAAHPIYEQLMGLIEVISGTSRSAKTPLYVELDDYGLDGLLLTDLRLDTLVSIGIAIHGEIDPATISRWFSEHDHATMRKRLWAWEQDGLLIRRRGGVETFYRFNPDHPYVPALEALFERIAEVWPDYGDLPALERHLYPPARAARERNRPRPIIR